LTRRNFLCSATYPASAALFQSSRRPNIVFLLADDQRWDTLGCAGNNIIQTPNIDALASDGVQFRNMFVTTAICAVSRASIFSGQYERTHGISDFATAFTPAQFANTYPARLRASGYRTGFIGKWGVGNEMPKTDFDYFRGFPGQGNYVIRDGGREKHLTNVMADQAVEFLTGGHRDQPFCLSVSFKAPHAQDEATRQYLFDPALRDLYKEVTIPVAETAAEQYYKELPQTLRDSEGHRRWGWRFATPTAYQDAVKGYYRLITGIDRAVAQVRKTLEETSVADNTVIVYTSDNGYFLGERGLADKWYMFEESIRVPMVVYDPRLPADRRGVTRPEMVLNIDLAPTLLDCAGVPAPASMQGDSILPLVRGEARTWRDEWYYSHLFEHPQIPKSEGIRTVDWKYFRFIGSEAPIEYLYDLRSDPSEKRNLIQSKTHSGRLQRLRASCSDWSAKLSRVRQ
jgi:arylsulfatase A-like enzyme